LPPKRLRQRLQKPLDRKEAALVLPGFMNFSIPTGNQMFEVPACFWFARESNHPGQISRRALVKKMKSLELLETHPIVGLRLELIQRSLERDPIRPFGGEETGKINNHGQERRHGNRLAPSPVDSGT